MWEQKNVVIARSGGEEEKKQVQDAEAEGFVVCAGSDASPGGLWSGRRSVCAE